MLPEKFAVSVRIGLPLRPESDRLTKVCAPYGAYQLPRFGDRIDVTHTQTYALQPMCTVGG